MPLRNSVAHGRNTARNLRGCADFAREQLDLFGIATIGLMRREHVVVGRNDPDIERATAAQHSLIFARGRKTMSKIAARERVPIYSGIARAINQGKISGAAGRRARNDPVCHFGDDWVDGHYSLQ